MSNTERKTYEAPSLDEIGDLKAMTQGGELYPADAGNKKDTAEPVLFS